MPDERVIVLLLDDSIKDQAIYQDYFLNSSTHTYDVQVAPSAEEGLQFCREQWPDLIILNVIFPDLSAIQFMDELRNLALERPLPPYLLLITQAHEAMAINLLKEGVQDYLLKDRLTEQVFHQTVERALEKTSLKRTLAIQAKWQQVLFETALRIRQSLTPTDVLETAVQEVQRSLQCDRAIVYQFNDNWLGTVVAESVELPYAAALGMPITDTCLQKSAARLYQQGQQTVITDIYQQNLSACHIRLLESFQVRALIVTPILLMSPNGENKASQLWGLLIVHQCSGPRRWTESAVSFLNQLSVQLAIAIQQAELLHRLNQELFQKTQAEYQLRQRTKEQERLIQELAKTTSLLQQRNQELDSFVSMASHDLRAPLRAVRNLTTWITEDLGEIHDPDIQQNFDLLISRVQQMEALLNDLLQYSRIGRMTDRVTTVCVASLLNEIIQGLEVPPQFTIQVGPNMPTLITNRSALAQVFSNLISNAVKHHNRLDGRVEIRATDNGDDYCFTVSDDGPGIAPENHQKIFEIFAILGTKQKVDSTGIGLAIVKKLVEFQGGSIVVASTLGSGTTFRFTWPLSKIDQDYK
jgi:signal transduction histidine kinase/DNA-binding NarL/FixJ family response regulator